MRMPVPVLTLCLVTMLTVAAPGQPSALGQGLTPEEMAAEAPEQQLDSVVAAISEVQDWLDSATNNRSSQETELRATTRQIDTTTAAIADNERAIAELQQALSRLHERRDVLEARRDEQEELVRRALRASYMSGRESYLKLLLNQEDPSLSARMLRYYAEFNDARLVQIQQFRDLLQELAVTTDEIDASGAALAARQQELTAQLALLDDDRATRESLLKELDASIAERSGELEELEENRGRLEELIDRIEDAIADIPPPQQLTPFAQARGSMPWPVDGRPLNRFGAIYSEGNLHRQGVVLDVQAGSPVRAVHPGRVVFSDWLRGSGLLVVVDHGDGYLSLYANNGTLVKQKGDWVNRGEALATAGDNGGMDRPGIYFEIRHDGQAQDPALWCTS